MKRFLRKGCSFLAQMLIVFVLIAMMGMPAFAVGPNNTTFEINKGETQTLFSGAISASVTAGNATEIPIKGYRGGLLQVQTVSGSGSWSIAIYTADSAGGTYSTPYVMAYDLSTYTAIPSITASCNSGTYLSYYIPFIGANMLKLVPTLTGSGTSTTFTFTPFK
jgi:hypothetical protein